MVLRVVVLVCALAAAGCGSTESHAGGGAGTGGAITTGGGSGASQGGSAGSSTAAGSGGSAGSAPSACMSRSTNQIAGTRIKYHVLRTAEGDEAYDGFYDSMTGEDCSEALASDGKMRCVPTSRVQTREFYTDASCTDPVYLQRNGPCGAAKYLELEHYEAGDVCQRSVQHFSVGASYTGPVFQFGDSGSCVPSVESDLPLVRKGALVDPSSFAELEPALMPEAGRVVREGYKSADGAFKVTGYHDTLFDVGCGFSYLRDKKLHCLPGFGYLPAFSDAECKTLVVGVPASCGKKPGPYYARAAGEGCDAGNVAIKVDQAFSGGIYLLDPMSNGCVPQQSPPDPGSQFFTSVDLPDSAMPEFSFTTLDDDPGRLKPMYRTSSDGSCSFYDFWDSELGVECYFSGDPQNGYHCLPDVTDYAPTEAFSDAGCTTPVGYFAIPTCHADQAPKFTTSYGTSGCGATAQRARKVNAGASGAAVSIFVGAPGNCTPLSLDPENTYFTVGPELPLTTFVSAQRMP